LFFGGFAGFWGFFECRIDYLARIVDLLPFQQLRNAQDLQAGEFVGRAGRLMEACFGGFFFHRLCRQLHADQDADFCFLALDDSAQVADVGGVERLPLRTK
jgi:hypothetical protein